MSISIQGTYEVQKTPRGDRFDPEMTVLQCAQVDFFQINDVSISAEDPPGDLSTARVLAIFRPLVSWRTVLWKCRI